MWITDQGGAVLLDDPWPLVELPSPAMPVVDIAGQQRFLNSVATCVENTRLPLNARPVLQNLEKGKFEKLSFLTGTLRGLLDKPADVNWGIRAASMFVLPFYVWLSIFVGRYHDKPWNDVPAGIVVSALAALFAIGLLQLLTTPFQCTPGHAVFRLAVVDAIGEGASKRLLLYRWAVVWVPLVIPVTLALLVDRQAGLWFSAVWLLLWIVAATYAVVHPHRGWHDRAVGTWVVRR